MLQIFFALLLWVIAINPAASLAWRLVSGGIGLLFVIAGIKQFRSPKVERKGSMVFVVFLSLLYILAGGCAFIFALNSSKLISIDLLRDPGGLLVVAMLPVGLVALFLSILDIAVHK